VNANTKYKDSFFSFLFSVPELLRQLYCALAGVELPPDIPVTINTLKNVFFMDRVNDISFEIGDKLVVLLEHQSSINPNMALRLLMYIARIYEKIVEGKNIYVNHLVRLPRPEFFVLYNGEAPYPDEKILKLSDAFEETGSLGIPGKEPPALELVVKVLNINEGKNEAVARKCKTLADYSVFIAREREFEKELGNREEALKAAMRYCREHDKLKEFLEQNASEVFNMLMTEWNWDDALAIRYEEGIEVGEERGLKKGEQKGRQEGQEEEREKTIKQLLKFGNDEKLIAQMLELPLDEVKRFTRQ
jgi:hypothetical protein